MVSEEQRRPTIIPSPRVTPPPTTPTPRPTTTPTPSRPDDIRSPQPEILRRRTEEIFGRDRENIVKQWTWNGIRHFELQDGSVARLIGRTPRVLSSRESATAIRLRPTVEAINEGKDPTEFTTEQTKLGSARWFKDLGVDLAETFIPGVWVKDWDRLSNTDRAINAAMDALIVVPIAGWAVRGTVKTGARVIRTVTKVAGTTEDAAKANRGFGRVISGVQKADPQVIRRGARELQEVARGKPALRALGERAKLIEKVADDIADLKRRTPGGPPPTLEFKSSVDANLRFLRNVDRKLRTSTIKPETKAKIERLAKTATQQVERDTKKELQEALLRQIRPKPKDISLAKVADVKPATRARRVIPSAPGRLIRPRKPISPKKAAERRAKALQKARVKRVAERAAAKAATRLATARERAARPTARAEPEVKPRQRRAAPLTARERAVERAKKREEERVTERVTDAKPGPAPTPQVRRELLRVTDPETGTAPRRAVTLARAQPETVRETRVTTTTTKPRPDPERRPEVATAPRRVPDREPTRPPPRVPPEEKPPRPPLKFPGKARKRILKRFAELGKDVFAHKVAFRQGRFFVVQTLDGSEPEFLRTPPQGLNPGITPSQTFTILETSRSVPTQKELNLGQVRLTISRRGVSFRRR